MTELCMSRTDIKRRGGVPDGYSHVYTFGHMRLLCLTDNIDDVFSWAFKRYVGLSVKMVRRIFCSLICGYRNGGWARIRVRWLTMQLAGIHKVPVVSRLNAFASIILEAWLGHVLGADNVVVDYTRAFNAGRAKYVYVRLDRAKAFCGCR
jgi:hypothetical protein